MRLKISLEALSDLEKIWIYTFETWSAEQADRYFHLIMHEINYLVEKPESGRYYGHVRKDYFCSKVKFHLVFYKVNRKQGTLEVIRILHQQMDLESRLND